MNYVLAVGGTGNKTLEAMVYAAAADAYYKEDKKSKIPLSCIHMLSVDVDATCGNTTRAKQALEHYNKVWEQINSSDNQAEHRGFHTRLTISMWNMSSEVHQGSIDEQVRNHREDQPLAWTLFQPVECNLPYSQGFRGHPDLGVLFFSDLIQKLEENQGKKQDDEFLSFTKKMESNLQNDEPVTVSLVGSIFGGTGASGIPMISRYLRDRFNKYNTKNKTLFRMSATLLLPYYNVPQPVDDENDEIVINSTVFVDKAKTALNYYGIEDTVSSDTRKGVFDALYLLGLKQEDFVSMSGYSYGSGSQMNDAHMMEWMATRSIAHFFRTAEKNECGCYTLQVHDHQFSWKFFDREEKYYRVGYGGMIKAAAVFLTECYPYLHSLLGDQDKKKYDNTVNYQTAFFSSLRRRKEDAELKEIIDTRLKEIKAFFLDYTRWLCQVLRTLPPSMREELPFEKSKKAMEVLIKKIIVAEAEASFLQNERQAPEEETAKYHQELDELKVQIEQCRSELTSSEYHTLVYMQKKAIEKQWKENQSELRKEESKLTDMEEDPHERYTFEKIETQRRKVDSLRKSCSRTQYQFETAEHYLFELQKSKISNEVKRDHQISENQLLDNHLTMKLEEIAEHYELYMKTAEEMESETEEQDQLEKEKLEKNADDLLQHIQKLIIRDPRDTYTIQKIMGKLGTGYRTNNNDKVEDAPARFLISLLYAVLDEVKA